MWCVVVVGGGTGREAMVSMRNVVAHRGEEKGGDIHMPTLHDCMLLIPLDNERHLTFMFNIEVNGMDQIWLP